MINMNTFKIIFNIWNLLKRYDEYVDEGKTDLKEYLDLKKEMGKIEEELKWLIARREI